MILTCPQCATCYQADEAKFPLAGRSVRCSKCARVWHEHAPGAQKVPQAQAIVEPPPGKESEKRAPPEPDRREPWFSAAGAPALAVLLLVALFFAGRYHERVIAAWPQTAPLYAGLGFAPDRGGINFTHVAYERQLEDGQSVLAVNGEIENVSKHSLAVPRTIRAALSDAGHHELYHWVFASSSSTLAPGVSAPFHTRVSRPPPNARHLEIRFGDS